jgi:flagellar basal body-associated protein FliL
MAEERNEKKTPEAAEETKKSDRGNKFLMVGILAGVVLFNTIVAFVMIKVTKPQSEEQKMARLQADSLKFANERATSMGATTAEAPIEAIVNIAGTDADRFLKAVIIFEYDDRQYPALGEELTRRSPKFQDLLINHLSSLTFDELKEPDAKKKIRKDLLKMVNATLPPKLGEVRDVLFTTYIIQ